METCSYKLSPFINGKTMHRSETGRKGEEAFFQVLGSNDMWKELKKHMYPGKKSCTWEQYENGDIAASNGYLSLMIGRELRYTSLSMDWAAENGDLEVIKFLCKNTKAHTAFALGIAASRGHLRVLKWLHKNKAGGNIEYAVPRACIHGKLEVVKYLHNANTGGFTKFSMYNAAARGHLDVVKFLHENRKEGCNNGALRVAMRNGHTQVARWLHKNRIEFRDQRL